MKVIDKHNLDQWLFDFFEGNLNDLQKADVRKYVNANPDAKLEFEYWQDSFVNEQSLEYPFQKSLLRPLGGWSSRVVIGGVGLILLALWGLHSMRKADEVSVRLTKNENQLEPRYINESSSQEVDKIVTKDDQNDQLEVVEKDQLELDNKQEQEIGQNEKADDVVVYDYGLLLEGREMIEIPSDNNLDAFNNGGTQSSGQGSIEEFINDDESEDRAEITLPIELVGNDTSNGLTDSNAKYLKSSRNLGVGVDNQENRAHRFFNRRKLKF